MLVLRMCHAGVTLRKVEKSGRLLSMSINARYSVFAVTHRFPTQLKRPCEDVR